jgi:hypothetical protein
MQQPGLQERHRDREGEISHKHGNMLIGTLRRTYRQSFVTGCPDHMKLSDVLQRMNEASLSKLRRDHDDGKLDSICEA